VAVYGIDFYGEGRFGQDPALILPGFAVDPFTSTPLDYSTLFISWTQPVSPDCVNLRLVRNNHNLPQSGGQPPGTTDDTSANADGAVVFTDVVARTPSWTDTGLGQGFAYYTMWGWSNSEQLWIRCSDLIGLVPLNWGYGNRLYDLLPMAYRDADIILVDPYNPWPEGNPSPPLQRYLSLLGFQMDFIRTELESLMSVNDAQNCSGALLPLLAQQFGLPHEPEIGMQQERQLVSNAIHLYKLKGSSRGLTEFTSIMTNYPSTVLVHHGYNELLCMDDSVMADGIGTWQPWPPVGTHFPAVPAGANAGLSLNYNPNVLTGPDPVPGMTNPLDLYPGFNPGPPTYNYSALEVSASGTPLLSAENSSFEGGTTGTWAAAANCTISNQAVPSGTQGATGLLCMAVTATRGGLAQSGATLSGVAVTAGHTYLINANFLSMGVNRQVQVTLQWFAGATSLSTSTSQQFIEVTNQWTTASMTATAPGTATSVTIGVNILSPNSGEMHYVDNILFGAGGSDCYITTGPIPITDFMSQFYGPGTATFRIQIWSNTGPRQVELSLWGDNGSGVPVQIIAPTVFTETLNDWAMMTITGPVNPYPGALPGASAPSGPASYYWIYPRVRIIGVSTGTHYITLCGLWPCPPSDIGANTPVNTPYDYPRDVKVTLQPEYANVLSNTCTTFANGFDGLSNTADPTQVPTAANQTCGISILYTDVEDPAGLFSVNGAGSLTVQANGPGATVWWGLVNTWSPAPPNPNGWFAIPRTSGPVYTDGKREDWFEGAQQGSANPRNWFDPVESWNFINQQYFGIGSGWVSGVWFADPPQPNYPGVAGSFEPFTASGPFNFSVYARYTSVLDPNNAAMVMGLRWYYPDGTWTEVAYAVTLTDTFARYSIAPADRTQDVLSQPPPEAVTGDMPVTFYPFVRFPRAQMATFLLNSAMLSPGLGLQPYTDASMGSSSGDYVQDSHGASYYYNNRVSRVARLNAELYRWLPMGATYTLIYGAGAVVPPLDPTLW
jgi:phage tail-like protein